MAPTTETRFPSGRTLVIVIALFGALQSESTSRPQPLQDPLKQPVPSFALTHEDITNGVAKLNQVTTDVAFAIEFPLGPKISGPAPPLATVVATVGPGTLDNALSRLCELDPTFSWQLIGNTIHLFPRALENDPTYLFNRRIADLEFKSAPDAQEALFQAVAQLPGTKEQIAILQTGMSASFSRPWTASFKDLTVREVIDKIAQQLGRNYGWQFGGATDFRVLTFHEKLFPKPAPSERGSE